MTRQQERLRQRAHGIVASAIKKGILVRQPCQECGLPNGDAHHKDYSKPLEVEWLCERHHMQRHRRYYPRVKRTQKQLGFVSMRVTDATHKAAKAIAKRDGVKLWKAVEVALTAADEQAKAATK